MDNGHDINKVRPSDDNIFRPKKIGLVVGLPFCGRLLVPDWALAFAAVNYPGNTNIEFRAIKGGEVGPARNEIAQHALDSGAEWLWFVDDDTAPPFFAPRKLIQDLKEADPDVMVAAGIYVSKQEYPEPLVYLDEGSGPHWRWKIGDVFECGLIGTGCMMIRVELFKHLPKPWFRTVDVVPDGLVDGELVMGASYSDDLYFCKKVKEAGFRILADGGIVCVHWDRNTQTPYSLPKDSYPLKPKEEAIAV